MKKIRAGIIGVTGYAGEELLRLLLSHPEVEITYLGAKIDKDKPLQEIFPHLSLPLICHSHIDPEEVIRLTDVIFLALPHGISLSYVPYFYERGKVVIDLSADYRLDSSKIYEEYYLPHTSPHLLKKKVYGLPELYRESIRKTNLIANPGCYPTSVILGLAPLLEKKLLKTRGITVDAKSGVTGAGRNPRISLLYSEVNESLKAYSVGTHRHQPEMEQELGKLAGEKVNLLFVPHLVPLDRGILSTIYAELREPLSEEKLHEIYKEFYQGEPFVKILPPGTLPRIKEVRGTNLCIIGICRIKDTSRLVILSCIDNLTKGASGQAIQNMNVRFGWEESLGLDNLPLLP